MLEKLPKRFLDKIDFSGECWNWTAYKHKDGYGVFKKDRKTVNAHRYIWELIYGEIPMDLCILHKCDNPACVKLEHLFLGTHQENMTDKILKGRNSKNENHGMAKLTKLIAIDIRKSYKRGSGGEFSLKGLSRKYGVSNSTISNIINNKRWAI